MGATFSRVKTWVAEILTASDLNAEFNNILTNLTPAGVDDESTNDAAMQATADPYPAAAISKPTSLQGEIQRLRYLIAQITGETYWYIDPDYNITQLMAKTGANLAIGSDADGDMYYRASSVLARLAKGAADTKLFMNAGATAPEWAVGAKWLSGSVDVSLSADIVVTGAGFKPSAVILLGGIGTGTNCWSIGFMTTDDDSCICGKDIGYSAVGATALLLYTSGTAYVGLGKKSLDSDGFTLTATPSGSPSGTAALRYLLIR